LPTKSYLYFIKIKCARLNMKKFIRSFIYVYMNDGRTRRLFTWFSITSFGRYYLLFERTYRRETVIRTYGDRTIVHKRALKSKPFRFRLLEMPETDKISSIVKSRFEMLGGRTALNSSQQRGMQHTCILFS